MNLQSGLDRLDRIAEALGDPRCTCHGPGLEVRLLADGEQPPQPSEDVACPLHRKPSAGTLRVLIQTMEPRAAEVRNAPSSNLHTLHANGRVQIHLPEPQ